MNLALHGFLLQVILSVLNFKHGFRLCSAGEPGYLDFDNLPDTNFSCQGKVIGGYYADVEAGCQMFHVCTIGQKDEIMDIKFLCLNGTVFDQETRVCERVDEVDCSKSERFYNLNLELYGNHAVTLSLHEDEDDDESAEIREDRDQSQQQHHMTSVRPSSTTSTTTTTTTRPSQPSTTSTYPTGYPQHFQPRPAFSPVQSSQSNTHFDDKNGGYHHQYIFHNDERNNNNNQATSFQLFSNQGVSSTTPTPQVHQQVRYSSTANPQVIHNEPSTATPIQYHVQSTSSTIQTLLNSNSNNPALINPLFHNHGVASTTEQFNNHNNNPREIDEYQDSSDEDQDEQNERRPLEPVQSTSKGKVSKLTLSPIPQPESRPAGVQIKSNQNSQQQQQRISINYLPTPSPHQTTISAFYPTQRSSPQKPQKPQNNQQVTQHIHVPPPPAIPQLKPHQITINLPPPDIQRIVQNPSPLLPSQSRVIVTAKASVSDESGRPLNASQLITLPLPTIPSNYDEYKEGDESFDPFYRDVPKIRNDRRIVINRNIELHERHLRNKRSVTPEPRDDGHPTEEVIFNAEIKDIKDLKANLPIIKAILFGLPIPEKEETYDPEIVNVENEEVGPSQTSPIQKEPSRDIISRQSEAVNIESDRKPDYIKPLGRQVDEEDYADVEMPTRFPIRSRQNNIRNARVQNANIRRNNDHRAAPSVRQSEVNLTPIVVKQNDGEIESKDTIQLFLRAPDANQNLLLRNENISVPADLSNTINKSVEVKTDIVKPEIPQTDPSLNKNNRRNQENVELIEDVEEYIPRRGSRPSRPKHSRYYDEYDVSESIETGTRQRINRLRQRPKERRINKYRDDYINEDDVDDEEYGEENVEKSHKSTRRGPQSRRIIYRNRNRNFDYEDEVEVDDKARVRTKSANGNNGVRERIQSKRYDDERRRRPESRRGPYRRRPPTIADEVVLQNKSEFIVSTITPEANAKLSEDVGSRIVEVTEKDMRYPYNEEHRQTSARKRLNSLDRDEAYAPEPTDRIKDDYLGHRPSYAYEYNESVEEDNPDDYSDYTDFKGPPSKGQLENRRNRNRFDDEIDEPRRKSHRRDKGRKFVEEEITTEKTKNEDILVTTVNYEQEPTTINVSVDYTITDEVATSEEYEDYNSPETTVKIEDTKSTTIPEQVQTTTEESRTEGVFKFTDELPRTEKKYDVPDNERSKDGVALNVDDYVDDNYEPQTYVEPKVKISVSPGLKSKEEDDKFMLTINDEIKESKLLNSSKTLSQSDVKADSKEEYYELYEDKLDSTTPSLSSEEYEDPETTTRVEFISTTLPPLTSSTTITSTSSTTTSTTTTTTTTEIPTTITTTSTTTTTSPPPTTSTSTTPVTRSKPINKFFKPIAFRKNYGYTVPSTTPSQVVIRRGQPLAGPKPTKSPPTYNELAAKPVIRRLPLLSRTTTTTSEASLLEDEITADLSKQISTEKNTEENYPPVFLSSGRYQTSASLETSTIHSAFRPLPTKRIKSNEVTTEEFDSATINSSIPKSSTIKSRYRTQSPLREQSFNNEVPKYTLDSNDTNNVPQKSEDSIAETSKSESESTTFNRGAHNQDKTTTIEDSNYKMLDVQTTTVRTFRPSERRKLEVTSVKTQIKKINQGSKHVAGFNCLEKEMYRFYGDVRDCRLFHYCSPGFTARQVLDFRFVCEEGTIFDEETQSCRHDVANPKCVKRVW